jgi:hypothetical protein
MYRHSANGTKPRPRIAPVVCEDGLMRHRSHEHVLHQVLRKSGVIKPPEEERVNTLPIPRIQLFHIWDHVTRAGGPRIVILFIDL